MFFWENIFSCLCLIKMIIRIQLWYFYVLESQKWFNEKIFINFYDNKLVEFSFFVFDIKVIVQRFYCFKGKIGWVSFFLGI